MTEAGRISDILKDRGEIMQEIKTSSLTYELSPREAEAFAGVVERLPESQEASRLAKWRAYGKPTGGA
jgi:hypothetical protein